MITSAPVALAAVRALGALPARGVDTNTIATARGSAALTGRTLERITTRGEAAHVLAWSASSVPTMEDREHGEYRWLRPAALRTWAYCLGLAWTERAAQPWPGEPFTLDELSAAAEKRGNDPIWIRAALTHTLEPAGLVEISGRTVRLGPAAAVLPGAYIDAVRRVHDRLPRRDNAAPATGTAL